MWYVDAGDCMLSASNRHQFPHLFTISDQYRIDFYEKIACTRNRTTSALQLMTTHSPQQQQQITKKPLMIPKIPLQSLLHPTTPKQINRKPPIAKPRELLEVDDELMKHIRTTTTQSSTTKSSTNTFIKSDMLNDASIGIDMNAIEERKCFQFEHGRELLGFEEERWIGKKGNK
jgi:hypothetical protein